MPARAVSIQWCSNGVAVTSPCIIALLNIKQPEAMWLFPNACSRTSSRPQAWPLSGAGCLGLHAVLWLFNFSSDSTAGVILCSVRAPPP